jgi:predicted GNAT family acetyltransferase
MSPTTSGHIPNFTIWSDSLPLSFQQSDGATDMPSDIQTSDVHDNTAGSRFELKVDGHTAFAEYKLAPGVITFTHTVVPPELGGRGIGSIIAKAVLGSARARHLKVVPKCEFIAGYIAKHPEFQDLVSG